MSFKTKSRDKIISAFSKIFKHDKIKSNEQTSGGNEQNDSHIDNNNNNNNTNRDETTGNNNDRKITFQKDIVSSIKNLSSGCSSNNSNSSNKLNCKTVRIKRLMKELSDIEKFQSSISPRPMFSVDLISEKLDEWNIKVYSSSIDTSSELYNDMKMNNVSFILLHMVFPPSFPFLPPFLRVVSPNIDKGFVMEGGALCLELLTPRGWSSAYSIESIIMQFTASVVKGHGRISKSISKSKSFSKKSAEEAFRNLVRTHDKYGWVTPPLAEG